MKKMGLKRSLKKGLTVGVAAAMLATAPSSVMPYSALAVVQAATVNDSLTVPFGQDATYNASQGIGFVWGAAGYDSYKVTISCDSNDYEKVYEGQELGYHWYPDTYEPGTYTIKLQGEQGEELSPAATATVTIPGNVEEEPKEEEPKEEEPKEDDKPSTETPVEDEDLSFVWTTNGSAEFDKKDDDSVSVNVTTSTGNNWDVQYYGEGLKLVEGKKYTFTADLYSETDAKVQINIQETNSWGGLLDSAPTFELTAGEKRTVTITTNAVTSPFVNNTRVAIMFGGSLGNEGKTIKVSNMKIAQATSSEEKPVEETPEDDGTFIDFTTIDHQDYVDAGTNVKVTYDADSITATGSDWGNEWGGDSKWQIQLKELVPVEKDSYYKVSFKAKSDKDAPMFLKLGDVNNNGAVFYEGDQNLKAGNNTIEITTTKPVDIDKLMVLFALGNTNGEFENTIVISNLKVEKVVEPKYLDLSRVDHSNDYLDGGTNISTKYTKDVLTVSGNDWGGDWGYDSKWQIQLKNLVKVTSGKTYTLAFKVEAEKAAPLFLKLGDLNNDGAVFYEGSHDLNAGVNNIEVTTTKAVDIESLMILYALGNPDGGNFDNTVKVSKVSLKDEDGNYVDNSGEPVSEDSDDEPVANGKEHDFSAVEDNEKYDYPAQPIGLDGYDLIWNDEFDGNYGDANVDGNTGLNLDNWAYQLGDGSTDCNNYGWGNNELQCYTGNTDNIAVNEDLTGDNQGDGYLRITAQREDNGYRYANESSKNYTSARIRSTKPDGQLFNTTYGHVEARIALPQTAGAWPAFWMLPESTEIYGNWPTSGEIDIMETTGTNADKACGTLHWGAPEHVYKGSGYTDLNSEISYFHTYAVDWQPGSMTWIYDGQPIYTLSNWKNAIAGDSDALSFDAPFDQPFYMLLNLAVDSGQFGGSANKANFDGDINMYVDYVRVYQKTEGYPGVAYRTAGEGAKTDWQQYAGLNQIAEITTVGSLDSMVGLADADTDMSKWYVSNQTDANGLTGEVVTIDGKKWIKANVVSGGGQDYSNQIIGHYNAKAGYVYKISFDAYADGGMVGKTVNCDSKEWAGWSTYGIQSFALAEEPTSYSFLVNQVEDFDNCRIEFNIGKGAAGSVFVSNVKVEIVNPEALAQEEASRTPLPNGDLIYNGTFDEGNDHVGYWTALGGTKLYVPRYTTEAIAADDVKVIDVASKTNYENIPDGVKYYERRAQISSEDGTPGLYQYVGQMKADDYTLTFDMYSKEDTTITAAVYTTDETGTLGQYVKGYTLRYNGQDGVNKQVLNLSLDENIDNAAVLLHFGKGAEVQIDNVTFKGANQAAEIDETPLTADDAWNGDDGNGNSFGINHNTENGVNTAAGLTSGGAWYSPQIISPEFTLVAGQKYKFEIKYRLEGNTNNTFKYIVQEAGGAWTVYEGANELTFDPDNTDSDGFCSASKEFVAAATLPNVHVVLGLGESKANNASLLFKDATITLVKAQPGQDGEGDSSWEENDADDMELPTVEPADPSNPSNPGQTPSTNPSSGSNAGGSSSGSTSGSSSTAKPVATTQIADTITPVAGLLAENNKTAQSIKSVKKPAKSTKTTTEVEEEVEDAVEEEVADVAETSDEELSIASNEDNNATNDTAITDEQVPAAGNEDGFSPVKLVIAIIILLGLGAAVVALTNKFGKKASK
ncbi:MAG: glycoside hydrolase family 16 protein [Pseudobutyrivibrio sp.]|nr:glycoside hydrolase family 16 protein [Pseudobutyrivibrio sp.]